MANVIDSLVVSLGLDASKFSAGQKQATTALKDTEAQANKTSTAITTTQKRTDVALRGTSDQATRTAKEMQARGPQAAEFFTKISGAALGLFAVLLGGKGMVDFSKTAVSSLASLGRVAHNIGMSVPELAAFRNMIERNGGSADAASASFQGLTNELENLKVTGRSAIIPFLNVIGAKRGDNAMAVYRDFVKFAAAHKDDQPLVTKIGAGLGLDEGSINEARKGVAAVNADLAESFRQGVPTDEMIKRLTRLQKAWIALRQTSENIGDTILSSWAPAISGILENVTTWIEGNRTLAKGIAEIGAGLTAISAIAAPYWLLKLLGIVGKAAPVAAAEGAGAVAAGGVLGAASKVLGPLGAFLYAMRPSTTNTGEKQFLRDHRAEQAVNILTAAGGPGDPAFTKEQAAGIVGNFSVESGLNPAAVGDNGQAFGIGQWHPDRQAEFQRLFGHPIQGSDLEEQARFARFELNQGQERAAGERLRNETTAAGSAVVVRKYYERPLNAAGDEDTKRIAATEDIVNRIKALPPDKIGLPGDDLPTTLAKLRQLKSLPLVPPPDPGILLGANATAPGNTLTTTHNTSSSETHIGTVNVQTQATDAKGIAASIGPAIKQQSLATQANAGLS